MCDKPKYQFQHGPKDGKFFTREEAIKDMEAFIQYVRKADHVLEKTWFLYLHNDQWICLGSAMVDELGAGDQIQEFKV